MRMIVCAANKCLVTGVVILGVRHWDELMHDVLKAYPDNTDCFKNHNKIVQGFVDNKRNFLTRTEAWKIAFEAGQIVNRCGGDSANSGTLYSENLY
jgi:hypothetical protein